jgi:predicted acetyltransferase
MSVEIRPCSAEELTVGLEPIFHYFGRTPTQDSITSVSGVLEPGRLHAAFEDGRAVGGAGAFTFQVTVPGGRVPAAGVTTVGVLPTHRRRGILREMMRAQLDDIHARGEPLAYLWASEATIYGRFGYGVASLAAEMEIPRNRADFARPAGHAGTIRLLTRDEALEVLPALYERVAVETPGMFARTREWWETRALADPEWRRQGGGEMVRALLELDGEAQAYALYRLHPAFEYSSSTGHVTAIEVVSTTPAATARIWRYLFDIDWLERLRAALLPVDHPLLFLLAEPRRARFTLADGVWLRLVDVEAALAARRYTSDERVVLAVADAFCAWNEGRWLVEGGASRTDEEADVRLGVDALASVYLGGFTFRQLERAGVVEELAKGGIERADRLFYTDRAPWCPEIF